VAKKYLGVDPIFYSSTLFWSRPGVAVNPITQAFHRDEDDFKSL
jgi:hypothetical protein